MGRLSTSKQNNQIVTIKCVSGETSIIITELTGVTTITTTTTPIEIIDKELGVYTFIDKNGNVTQINKKNKKRYKYCADPKLPQQDLITPCVIGISGAPGDADCIYGKGLGFGDTTFGYAKYV